MRLKTVFIAFMLIVLSMALPAIAQAGPIAQLTTDKASYPIGETVTITLTNVGDTPLFYAYKRSYSGISNSTGEWVVEPPFKWIAEAYPPLQPNQSMSSTWNQKYVVTDPLLNNAQVPPGEYTVWACHDYTYVSTSFTILEANQPPVADANGPYEMDVGEPLELDGSASYDPDEPADSIVAYEWDLNNDGDFGDASGPTPSIAAEHFDPGSDPFDGIIYYNDIPFTTGNFSSISLRVTDTFGETDEATTTLTINNNPPVANANGPYTIEQGSLLPIELDGTGSYDPDTPCDAIVKYEWDTDGDNQFDDGEGETFLVTWPELKGWGMSAPGEYDISLRVTDSFGATSPTTTTLTVKNVLPTVDPGGPYFGVEGSPLLFSAIASDPGEDPLTFKWDFQNDGTFEQTGQTAFYTFQDDYVGENLLCTHDYDPDPNRWVESFFDVYIQNVPPEVEPIADMTVKEGETVTLSTTFTDPGIEDTHTYTIDWKDGTVEEEAVEGGGGGGGAIVADHTYADNGVYTVTLTVEDDDDGSTTITTTVTVQNVTPTITYFDPGSDPFEGQVACVLAGFTDPGSADTHKARIIWGDGTPDSFFDVFVDIPIEGSHTYADNGVYTVTLTVEDDDGGTATITTTVTVQNVAPTISPIPPQTIDEGDTLTLTPIITDPGCLDTHTLTIDWDLDDEIPPESFFDVFIPIEHVYPDDGTFTVVLTVEDDDGEYTTCETAVTVQNVSPTVEAGPDQEVNEGDMVAISGSFTDPGLADTHQASIDWGDGYVESFFDVFLDVPIERSHTYDDNGVYIVTLRVTDDDGGVGEDVFTISVNNVSPTVSVNSVEQPNPEFVLPGDTLNLIGSLTDPGAVDTHTARLDWGDGTPESFFDVFASTFSATHAYTEPGIYTATLTVEDDDGGSATVTTVVTVISAQDVSEVIDESIQELPPEVFRNNADQRIDAFSDKFAEVIQLISTGQYQDAINKLQNDIRAKADGSLGGNPNNDWITDPAVQQRVCDMIDDLVAYLNTLL